jgi:dTDP-4-dehydrorhamnose reductase
LLRAARQATGERVEIRDAVAVSGLLVRLRPDVVVHTAYRQNGTDARAVVVAGSANVARAAHAVGAQLVHLSTDVVFDGRKGAPYDEDDVCCPVSPYGEAKAEAELAIREMNQHLARTPLARSERLHYTFRADFCGEFPKP